MATKSKPKPRVALYAGLAGSALMLAGEGGAARITAFGQPLRSKSLAEAAGNVSLAVSNVEVAGKVAMPALIGLGGTLLADWTGVNKRLAKARIPFRI